MRSLSFEDAISRLKELVIPLVSNIDDTKASNIEYREIPSLFEMLENEGGYESGYDAGEHAGYQIGLEEAKEHVEGQKEEQYEKGFNDGNEKGFDDGKEDGYNKAKSEFMAKLDDPRYIDYHAGKCLINHYVTGDDIEHCVDI